MSIILPFAQPMTSSGKPKFKEDCEVKGTDLGLYSPTLDGSDTSSVVSVGRYINQTIFDDAERAILYLVRSNTWPRYLDHLQQQSDRSKSRLSMLCSMFSKNGN